MVLVIYLIFPVDFVLSLSYLIAYIKRGNEKMKYIMRDWRKQNERYRLQKSCTTLYMWLASGVVAANLLYWIVP